MSKGPVRKGPGRPPTHPLLHKEYVTMRLPRWLLDWMAAQDQSRAVLIEDALRRAYKIKPPKID